MSNFNPFSPFYESQLPPVKKYQRDQPIIGKVDPLPKNMRAAIGPSAAEVRSKGYKLKKARI